MTKLKYIYIYNEIVVKSNRLFSMNRLPLKKNCRLAFKSNENIQLNVF